VQLTDGTIIQAQFSEDNILISDDVVVPIRPERVGIIPRNITHPAETDDNFTVLEGKITDTNYIGTDTRYVVNIAGDNHIVVRIQNSDYEERYPFKTGNLVKVFWNHKSVYVLNH